MLHQLLCHCHSTDSSKALIVLIPICSEIPLRLSRSASSRSTRVSVHPIVKECIHGKGVAILHCNRNWHYIQQDLNSPSTNFGWAYCCLMVVAGLGSYALLCTLLGNQGKSREISSWLTLPFESLFLLDLQRCPVFFSLCNSDKWCPGHLEQPGGLGQDKPPRLGLWRPQLKQNPYDAAYCRLTATRSHCLTTGHCCNRSVGRFTNSTCGWTSISGWLLYLGGGDSGIL